MKLIVFVTLFGAVPNSYPTGASINVTFPKCVNFGKNFSFIKLPNYILFC